MNIQVLVASMNQEDDSLVKKMNICTDAKIGNQCDRCSNEHYSYDDFEVEYYNRPDRGVGMNRNVLLCHSSENCILTLADDDMIFEDNYDSIILKAFNEIPDADAIIFNIKTIGAVTRRRVNRRVKRIRFYNCLNYGAARISIKSNSIRRENITFHTCFGGGTRYSNGEDTIFVSDLLKHKLHVYAYPACIASVDQTSSTWFHGYDKKYLFDKGALFEAVSKRWASLLCLQDLIRHKYIYKEQGLSFKQAVMIMKEGKRAYLKLQPFETSAKS